jgi:hypothetical protein
MTEGRSDIPRAAGMGPERAQRSPMVYFLAAAVTLCFCCGLFGWIAVSTGAIFSSAELAKKQAEDPHLVVLPPDLKYWGALKVARAAEEQPEVIFIGTSRCQEFRSAMLRPYKAFNACLAAWTLDQYADLLRRLLAVSHPKIVILELDYFLFTDVYADGYQEARRMHYDQGIEMHQDVLSDLAKTFVDDPDRMFGAMPAYLFGRVSEPYENFSLLGVQAIRNGVGFRYDGSFLLPAGFIAESAMYDRDVVGRFFVAFPGAPKIAPRQLDALRALARIGKENGVTLVGIQLPYLGTAVDYLDHNPSYHELAGVWREFEGDAMHAQLRELGIHFFDLARDPITADAHYFADPAHPGEAGILAGLIHLDQDPEFRAVFPALDAAALRRDYAVALEKGDYFRVYLNRF